MKKLILRTMVLISFFGIFGCSSDPATWNDDKINDWFEKGEWLNGWNVKPHESVNRKEFAVSYFKNKERWDKTFNFLKSNDLSKIEIKRHDIDGDNLFANVSEYVTRNEEGSKFEVHRKYIDIQYIVNGVEKMYVAPISKKKESVTEYNDKDDYELMLMNESTACKATPETFFIFFPDDAHSPGLKMNENSPVRKVVVKFKID